MTRDVLKSSLRVRLMVNLLTTALLVGCFAAAGLYWAAYRNALIDGQRQVSQVMDAVEYSAAIAAYTGDQQMAADVVRGLLRSDFVCQVQISNEEGKLKLKQGKAVAEGQCQLSVDRQLHSPFEIKEVVGSLRAQLLMPEIAHRAMRSAVSQMVSLLLLLAVSTAIAWLGMSRILTHPLLALSRQVHFLKPGTDARLNVPVTHENDEIGVLVGDINQLLTTVERTVEEERRLRNFVEALESQYQTIFEYARTGITLLDHAGHCVLANPAAGKMLGVDQDVEGPFCLFGNWADNVFAAPDDFMSMLRATVETNDVYASDLSLRREEGLLPRWLHVSVASHSNEGVERLVECLLFDVSERKRREDATRYIAEHDQLTHLLNRWTGQQILQEGINRLNVRGAVLVLDLDHFKEINDTYGHEAGDLVLVEIGRRLSMRSRSADVVARLGGDEFMIGLFDIHSPQSLKGFLERLILEIDKPIDLGNGVQGCVGVSIGLVIFPESGTELIELTRLADVAMYLVKNAGRNGYCIYNGNDFEAPVQIKTEADYPPPPSPG